MELPPASSRPSRLSTVAHVMVVGSLALSFVSGETLAPPTWMHTIRVLHGVLNPLQCVVFGYLVAQHIRYGWALRANWVSGLAMEGVFAVLIVSSLAVYYADEGLLRSGSVWVHRVCGAGLPVVLVVHWICGHRWVRKNF